MRDSFKTGLSTTKRITIDEARTLSVAGGEFRVYATPDLVRDIEQTCKSFILDHAGPGEDSVGTQVHLDHIGATLMGMAVEITVTVREIDRRRIQFEFTASDNIEPIARGTHDRFVTDAAKSAERLRAKAAKLAGYTKAC